MSRSAKRGADEAFPAHPPQPAPSLPFAVCFTRRGRRQGWQSARETGPAARRLHSPLSAPGLSAMAPARSLEQNRVKVAAALQAAGSPEHSTDSKPGETPRPPHLQPSISAFTLWTPPPPAPHLPPPIRLEQQATIVEQGLGIAGSATSAAAGG